MFTRLPVRVRLLSPRLVLLSFLSLVVAVVEVTVGLVVAVPAVICLSLKPISLSVQQR
jgi:hypothetical protein